MTENTLSRSLHDLRVAATDAAEQQRPSPVRHGLVYRVNPLT